MNKKKALPCILDKPCENNGVCTDDNLGGYTCTCPLDISGKNCDLKPSSLTGKQNKRHFEKTQF